MTADQRLNDSIFRLKNAVMNKAVKRGLFKLSSGGESTYYIDCRKMSMTYLGMQAVGDAILASLVVDGIRPNVVCGPESAGIPLACAAVMLQGRSGYSPDGEGLVMLTGCFVRKESRDHGTKNMVEGCELAAGDRVVVVEDVATTGASLIRAIEMVRRTGAEVVGSIVLVDRLQGAGDKIRQMGVPYRALLDIVGLGLA